MSAPASDYCKCEHTLFIHPDGGKCNGITPITQFTCDCKQFVSEPADATAEKPSPDYTALIEQFESLAWLHHKDAKNSGSHWDLECRMCDIIKQMRATLEAVSAPAPVSNTLRERIAYALGDVSARCHVELGRNPLMLELADAVLALLDEKAVTE